MPKGIYKRDKVKIESKICPICNKEFTGKWFIIKNKTYCSVKCSAKYNSSHHKQKPRNTFNTRKCLTCGKEFSAWDSANRVFCSRKCKRHSEETKLKCGRKPIDFSERLKKAFNTEEIKQQRTKQSPWLLCSNDEQKQIKKKISKSLKNYYKNNPERIEVIREQRLKQILPIQDTFIEIALQEELDRRNITYIKHPVIGKYQPDIYIPSLNIVIFADGCYWHGCSEHGKNYNPNKWRDDEVNKYLEENGYKYYRFWEHEIKESPKTCIDKVVNFIR